MSKIFNTTGLSTALLATLFVIFLTAQVMGSIPGRFPSPQSLVEKVQTAKGLLQQGVNAWDITKMKQARDKFLSLHLQENETNVDLLYYLALSDYRMATYHITQGVMEEMGIHLTKGKKFLERIFDLDPDWGEPYAIYVTLLGLEIAMNPEEAMTIAFEIGDYFGKAFAKDPDNPRTNLLKGTSELFTPEAYGGGPDIALDTLTTALNCFEEEKITNPMKPSWGKDDVYTFMGMAYNQKGETQKAREHLKKALSINPNLGLAKDKLEKIKDL